MEKEPPRFLAFMLAVVAGLVLTLPISYAVNLSAQWGPFGNLLAWTTVCVAGFGIVTVMIAVARHFIAPALQLPERRDEDDNV